jgi:hypothetical protein
MTGGDDRSRIAKLIRRLLQELQKHEDDYHHVTPPSLLEEALELLRELEARNRSEGS